MVPTSPAAAVFVLESSAASQALPCGCYCISQTCPRPPRVGGIVSPRATLRGWHCVMPRSAPCRWHRTPSIYSIIMSGTYDISGYIVAHRVQVWSCYTPHCRPPYPVTVGCRWALVICIYLDTCFLTCYVLIPVECGSTSRVNYPELHLQPAPSTLHIKGEEKYNNPRLKFRPSSVAGGRRSGHGHNSLESWQDFSWGSIYVMNRPWVRRICGCGPIQARLGEDRLGLPSILFPSPPFYFFIPKVLLPSG